MDKPARYPGFTALLPPRVRYDQELRPTAKLLYAEISAMADVTGFCWASNRYLAALFGVTKNTVTELLSQLAGRGYIEVEVLRDKKNAVSERRLYITDAGLMRLPPITKNRDRGTQKNQDTPPPKNQGTPPPKNRDRGTQKNQDTPPPKNQGTPPPKNREENDTSIERIPPYSPPRGTRRAQEHKDTTDWMSEDFEKLWQWYPTGELPRPAPRGNRQRAIRAWDKLHPSAELVDVIAAALAVQAQTEQWQQGVGVPHLSSYLNGYGWEEVTHG